MRTNVSFAIAGFSVLSLVICGGVVTLAQTSAAAPRPTGVASQDSTNDLSVAVGKSVLVDFAGPVQRVAVGMSDIAEATATSPNEVMVNGKAPGQTSLIVWEAGGARQFFDVTVRPSSGDTNDRMDGLRRELRAELPGQPVKVSTANGTIFLRGNVKDLNSSDRAVQIASTAGKVVNLLYVDIPAPEKQILLKVQFASVDLSKAQQMGINLISLGMGNTVGGITTGQFTPPAVSGGSGSTNGLGAGGYTATFTNELNFLAFFPGLGGGADIQALQTSGVVEVLSEPNVIAINGKQASFLAGGEYPYPVVQGGTGGTGASISIMFKEYGVRLNFIPTITPRGTIRLQVAPEVSSLDFTDAVEVSGYDVPAISVRRVRTEAELGDGESLLIGGLLDKRETETFQKIPFIGDIPILGKFFQSISKTRTNTELIVIVTPEIIDPIPAGVPLPELKYPRDFLPNNSSIPMHNPDAKASSAVPAAPAVPNMPVEKLIQSMRPETPLITDANMSPSGGGGGGAAPAAASPSQ